MTGREAEQLQRLIISVSELQDECDQQTKVMIRLLKGWGQLKALWNAKGPTVDKIACMVSIETALIDLHRIHKIDDVVNATRQLADEALYTEDMLGHG